MGSQIPFHFDPGADAQALFFRLLRRLRAGPTCDAFSKKFWSGRRDSNPQPSAWEADALPLRHTRSRGVKKIVKDLIRVNRRDPGLNSSE